MRAGQAVLFNTLDGRLSCGVYDGPLSERERQRLRSDSPYHTWVWLTTPYGRSWFDADRLLTVRP